ncbi:cytoplasmic tRNA 2-thiolation protein 2 [Phyllosticta citricarpa]|uniref:Cytoplasmic tRNA 2-thiolation protein 2 n=2 Tax=Phyllosticta TaxID=121621 RepID=A0ABR1LYL5_9PEZI
MPAKLVDADPAATGRPCKRCKDSDACIVARQEPFCRNCFMNYLRTKAVKRMESYAYTAKNRKTTSERKLLLPVSFGVSSTTLVALLHEQLERQRKRTGRTPYTLHVLFIDTSVVEPGNLEVQRLEQLRNAYPGHEYSSVGLASVYQGDQPDLTQEFDVSAAPEVEDVSMDPKEKLEKLFLSLSSVTARADLISILRRRLAVRFAKANNCSDIMWGDSTTNLAARALAETAKGRGFALPWLVADGVSPSGIAFRYPLQDVYKKELLAYVDMASSPLKQLIQPEPAMDVAVSAKNTTIDGLMRQYFDSVQQEYPGIVANVARTSSRLEAASSADEQCRLCQMPVADGRFGIHGWGGDQDNSTNPQGAKLCYGCTRSASGGAELMP